MRPDVLSSDDGGRGFHATKLRFFLLVAFELENHLPMQAPLDATAIAAGIVNRWYVLMWFGVESYRSRVDVRAAFRGLRCAFRYGPVARASQSSLFAIHGNRSDPSMARACHSADRPWIGVPAAS